MSTRIDWGYFDKSGNPVAVGDEWHKWICPERKYEPTGYEHHITGEWIDTGMQLQPHCAMKSIDAKLERCERCAMEFRYP